MLFGRFKKELDACMGSGIPENIVIGFSGGPDSSCLAYLFFKLKSTAGYGKTNIILAHLNHMLRGGDSDADENFSRDFAEKHGFKFISRSVNVNKYRADKNLSLETAARVCRYDFFKEVCAKYNAPLVLAHHLDDQIETVLMNIDRGCGILGLCGIPAVNEISGIKVIRPLLSVKKSEILECLNKERIAYCTDASNFSSDYTRNYYRNKIIPALFNEGVLDDDRLSRVSCCAKTLWSWVSNFCSEKSSESELIKLHNEKSMTISISQLLEYNLDIRSELLRYFFYLFANRQQDLDWQNYSNLSRKNISDINMLMESGKSGNILDNLPGNVMVLRDYDNLLIKLSAEDIADYQPVIINSMSDFPVEYCGMAIGATLCESNVIDFSRKKNTEEFFDIEKIKFPLILRPVKIGDRFSPFGLKGTMLVSDFFTNNKINHERRKDSAVLIDAEDNVLWLMPFRISNIAAVSDSSEKVVRFATH